MTRNPMCRPVASLLGAVLIVTLGACSQSTNGSGGVGATDNQPVATSGLRLGGSSVAGVTVSGTSLVKSGSGIAVLATISSTHPDRLLSISSNYTVPAALPQPLAVEPGAAVTIGPTTVVLRPNGPIDDGATVAVSFTFATAGVVQVYGTYRA